MYKHINTMTGAWTTKSYTIVLQWSNISSQKNIIANKILHIGLTIKHGKMIKVWMGIFLVTFY